MSILSVPPYSLHPTAHGLERNVTLQPFLADEKNNTGFAVIICPGGSYSWLGMHAEGYDVAHWLQRNGINAYLLRYRVATVAAYILGFRVLGLGNKYPDMQMDVDDALRYVYEHAEQDHINTDKIGVMGFSAGGHLAMCSYLFNQTCYKPHFIGLIYPVVSMSNPKYTHKRSRRGALGFWGQWDKTMRDNLSIEKHIPNDCPPVFLINCKDDPTVKYQNSELLDNALSKAHVVHKYILYQTGGHGFGASDKKGSKECQQWKNEFIKWISNFKA